VGGYPDKVTEATAAGPPLAEDSDGS
jgi:hypothetical protein